MSVEDSGKVEQDPLLNSDILEEIFKYCCCDVDAFKRVRQVCKAWLDASAFKLKSFTFPLILTQTENQADSQMTTSLRKFLRKKQNSKCWNEAKYFVLNGWTFQTHHFVASSMDQFADSDINYRFWDLYTKNITILTLRNCTIPCSSSDPILPRFLLRTVPNLERLSLVDCEYGKNIDISSETMEIPVLEKVVSLRIQNFRPHRDRRSVNVELDGAWDFLSTMFPNLKKLCVRRQRTKFTMHKLVTESWRRSLKELDIMENLPIMDRGCHDLLRKARPRFCMGLRRLSLNISTNPDDNFQIILNAQADTLEELHLFRVPTFLKCFRLATVYNFPNLVELHLWGTLCDNLDFLWKMPRLKTFKWITSCYDDESEPAMLLRSDMMEAKNNGVKYRCLFNGSLVTKTIPKGFALNELTTLEMDWGPISEQCWRRLGSWFPNLRQLKGTVKGNKEFYVIGEQWPEIEHLQLAHGSGVEVDGILDAFANRLLFQKLKSFIWKPCPCIEQTLVSKMEYWVRVEQMLRVRCAGGRILLPWVSISEVERQTHCDHAMFVKLLFGCKY